MADKLILRTTASLINSWSKCPTLGHYHDDLNLGLPEVKDDQGRTKGSLAHYILEVYYQLKLWSDFSDASIEAEAIKYGRRRSVELALTADGIDTVLDTMKQYFEHYKFDTMKTVSVEQPFSRVFYEDDEIRVIDDVQYAGIIVLMEGKIDWEVDLEGMGYIVDH